MIFHHVYQVGNLYCVVPCLMIKAFRPVVGMGSEPFSQCVKGIFMTTLNEGAASGPVSSNPPEFKDYVVNRDNEGPFTFNGELLAKASRKGGGGTFGSGFGKFEALEAAVYRTRGGNYITSLSKSVSTMFDFGDGAEDESSGGYSKAAAHKTFDDAIRWFKPGRLTDEIRKQLGLDKPVHID